MFVKRWILFLCANLITQKNLGYSFFIRYKAWPPQNMNTHTQTGTHGRPCSCERNMAVDRLGWRNQCFLLASIFIFNVSPSVWKCPWLRRTRHLWTFSSSLSDRRCAHIYTHTKSRIRSTAAWPDALKKQLLPTATLQDSAQSPLWRPIT